MNIKKSTAILLAGTIMATSLTACGINKNAVAAKLDDKEISLGLINFMCKYQQASADDLYAMYAESYGGDIWGQDLYGSGTTTWEQLVNSCVENTHELATLEAHMSEYKVELTDDEKAKITEAAKTFIDANSKEALNEMGANQEIVEEMLTLFTIKSKMHEAIIADVDTNVTDEEANCKGYSYVSIDKAGHYVDSEYVEYTEDELSDLAVVAGQVAADAGDGISLEEIANQYSLEVQNGTYDADDEDIDADLKTAVDALKEGEVTGLVETDSKYYVARLDSEVDEEATEKNRESIISERKEAKYDEVLSAWQEAETWKVYDKKINKIQIDNYFTLKNESTEETTTESTTE